MVKPPEIATRERTQNGWLDSYPVFLRTQFQDDAPGGLGRVSADLVNERSVSTRALAKQKQRPFPPSRTQAKITPEHSPKSKNQSGCLQSIGKTQQGKQSAPSLNLNLGLQRGTPENNISNPSDSNTASATS